MADKKKYDSSNIVTLRFPDDIRSNPGMYIGSTDSSGLWVTVREGLDNVIDEHLAGRGTQAWLHVDADGSYWVLDDAAGIPQGIKKHDMMINGKKTVVKTPTMQAIFSELHTSGKYVADAAYAASRGTHGVGVKATNATAEYLDVYTCFEGAWYEIGFKRGILTTPVAKMKRAPKRWDGQALRNGTLLHFKPDAKIFTAKSFPSSIAIEWAELASYLTPGFRVTISSAKGSKEFYSERGPEEYIERTMDKLKCAGESKIFSYKSKLADVLVAFTNYDGYAVKGYTNGLHQSSGGKHLDSVSGAIYEALKPWIKTRKVKVDGKVKEVPMFREGDLKEGMVGLVNMYLSKATFTSQDKAKLSDERAGAAFEAMLAEAASTFFKENKTLAQRIADRATKMNELKSKFTMSKQAASKLNAIKRNGLPAKYASFNSQTKIADRELFIVEGDSAGGTVKEARFPYQAVLPLKGKIMNALKDANGKTLESEEILNILAAIGYDVNAADPYAKLQVGKIICLADPDPDGPFVGDTRIRIRTQDDGDLGMQPHETDISKLVGREFQVPVWTGTKEIWANATARLERNVDTLVALEIGGTKYKVSEDHKFVCVVTKALYGREMHEYNGGNQELVFVKAKDLKVGDRIFCPANNAGNFRKRDPAITDRETGFGYVPVSKMRVQTLSEPVPVYCLTVPKFHSFMLPSGIVSSNCHINSLLLTLFYRYLPELFERGMVYVANAPEFYAISKGTLVIGDTLDEVQAKLKKEGANANTEVHHVKGYGELSAGLMRIMAMDPETRRLIQIKAIEDLDRTDFVRLMNDDVGFRRDMLGLPSDATEEDDDAPKPAKKAPAEPVKKVAAKKVATKTVAAKKAPVKKAK
jgi:DNA gyrase/topoisomerase IV subunit B